MTGPSLLFVYGTLRRNSGHLMAERLAGDATFVGEATIAGRLYETGTFPATTAPSTPDDRVVGDVWAIPPASADTVLSMLDQYEGYAPDARFGSLFVRVRMPIRFGDGSEQDAWVYRYNQEVSESERIVSGDWLMR